MHRLLRALPIASLSISIACASQAPRSAPAAPVTDATARTTPCRGDARTTGFDYWLGVWDVRPHGAPANAPLSENRITLEQDGCVVQEHWRSAPGGPAAGYTGTSFTTFDRARGAWHQTWVDNTGSVAVFEGNLDASGNLVLLRVPMPGDPDALDRRMSYRRQADGSVRQIVERSTDSGATWTTSIDLNYVRRR